MNGKEPDRKLLLVEGVDDKYFVKELCERHNYTGRFGILDKEGFPSLKAAITRSKGLGPGGPGDHGGCGR